MILINVPSVDTDGGTLSLAPSADEDGHSRVIVVDRRGEAHGVIVETLDLAAAVRALLASHVDLAAREAVRLLLDEGVPDMAPAANTEPAPVEPTPVRAPRLNRATAGKATRDVIRNLFKSADDRHSETMGASLARAGSFERFRRDAKAWLGDKTELSDKTIQNADYRVVYREFVSDAQK